MYIMTKWKTYKLQSIYAVTLTFWTLFFSVLPSAKAQVDIPEPTPPPRVVQETFELDPFYQQWIDVGGFPVVASEQVSPYALKEAAYLVYQMTKNRPDILEALVEARARLAVMATTEHLTDIPENRDWPVPYFHTVRGRAIGGSHPVVNEETVLNYLGNPYQNSNSVFHEFGHTVEAPGLRIVDPGFYDRLKIAYQTAVDKGLWKGTYTSVNAGEYWAEGTEVWFYPKGGVNSTRYGNTREALKARDPGLAALLTEVYGDDEWRYTLPETRLHQPHLQGFDPQNAPTFQYPPDAVALYEELLWNPESTGDGRWINLDPYPLSELPRLRASRTEGKPTEIIIGNFTGDNVLLVYSIAPDGTEHFRYRLRGDMKPFNSYVGQFWLIKDENGKNLSVYRAEVKTGRVLFLAKRCAPKVSDEEDLVNTSTTWKPGSKIEGPWLWMIAPTSGYSGPEAVCSEEDWLAKASGGSVTEQQIAINGAIAGDRVGDRVWTLGTIASKSSDNITEMVNDLGLESGDNIHHHVAYGSIFLHSPREQKTKMYVGSDDAVKVWLNGELVHNNPADRGAYNYQERFSVTLKEGKNILLVAVYNGAWNWSGFFGFEEGAEYTLSSVVEAAPTTPAWDVNQDGQVNVLDLVLVAQHLGDTASANLQADVNGDGTVNILDLVVVAQHLGESTDATAPSFFLRDSGLDAAMLQAWIAQAHAENDDSLAFRQGIANLQRLLALMIPKETILLANYPNPFNPETWIPYQLVTPADVTLTIYDIHGRGVRTLDLGHQRAGVYQSRSRAAYWDGKNAQGEPVANGVYFYTLSTGDFTATRKMLIRK